MSYTHFGQLGQRCKKSYAPLCIEKNIQLNKYETEPYFPRIFLRNTSVCLIIPVFCKICELNTEHEIFFALIYVNFQGDITQM